MDGWEHLKHRGIWFDFQQDRFPSYIRNSFSLYSSVTKSCGLSCWSACSSLSSWGLFLWRPSIVQSHPDRPIIGLFAACRYLLLIVLSWRSMKSQWSVWTPTKVVGVAIGKPVSQWADGYNKNEYHSSHLTTIVSFPIYEFITVFVCLLLFYIIYTINKRIVLLHIEWLILLYTV